ncbi:type II secretion system protein GspG [Patescibacteria group bacterium]|nr:type II secretion system protein GspG [Patescibacteria group bacterium]
MLIVVAIIGILAALIIVSLNIVLSKARDARRKADINEIVKALDIYYLDNGQFPASGGAVQPNGEWSNSDDSSWNTLAASLQLYINPLPKDPINTSNCALSSSCYTYTYYSISYGCPQQWYMLNYTLENKSDPILSQSPGVTACNGTYFNYSGDITIGEVKK